MGERFVVVDLETTGFEPGSAHIIEYAAKVIEPPWFGHERCVEITDLVKPPVPIPPETSAIHHIIDSDVAKCREWAWESQFLVDQFAEPGAIGVAHNANFERGFLAPLNLNCRWLCTYKASLRVWPDAPSHSNEALRYWLGLGTGRAGKQAPHSALHDTRVTAQILEQLLKHANVDDMIKWTDEPALLSRCPIGDWRGRPWNEIEQSFLRWILSKEGSMREDVVFCARTEILRREDEAEKERKANAQQSEDSDVPF
jgi:exodeoxyribonuclease X